jgi:hypothetical protein
VVQTLEQAFQFIGKVVFKIGNGDAARIHKRKT